MVIALVASIQDTSLRLSIYEYPRFALIYPIWVLPHAIINDSKMYKPTSHSYYCVFEFLIPRLIIKEDHGIMKPFVELFFQRRQRFDRSIEI